MVLVEAAKALYYPLGFELYVIGIHTASTLPLRSQFQFFCTAIRFTVIL